MKLKYLSARLLVLTCVYLGAGLLGNALATGESHWTLHRKHKWAPKRGDNSGQPRKQLSNWVYVTELPETTWGQNIAAGGDLDGDGFADVVIGEPKSAGGRGSLSFFYGSFQGLASTPDRVIEGTNDGEARGAVVQLIGDVNGDGLDDFFAGRFVEEKASGYERWVVYGSSRDTFQKTSWPGEMALVPLGDLDGDGFGDVGERRHAENKVLIFRGSADGLKPEAVWVLSGEQPGSEFGFSVAAAGDVNGDGYDDLVIGAARFSGKFDKSGKAYLFLGSNRGPSDVPSWAAECPGGAAPGVDDPNEQFFGWCVGSAGDVDRDGYADVLVSASFAERGDVNEGLAFLFRGSPSGLKDVPSWIAESNQPHAIFGHSLTTVHDLNGDGYDDVIVGVPGASNGQKAEGVAAVYYGSSGGLARFPNWTMESDHTNERFGLNVFSAGDINGDGYADVLVPGPDYERKTREGGITKHGRIVVGYGGSKGLIPSHQWRVSKPMLIAAHQKLDRLRQRVGPVIYWGPVALAFVAMAGVFLVAQARLRRRIRELVARNEELARNHERSRIARDIHDHLGADLTQIAHQARTAAGKLNGRPPERGALPLDGLIHTSQKALQTIDELIWVTDPRHDSLESLLAQIGNSTSAFLEGTGIRCRLDFPESLSQSKLSAKVRHEIFSCVKELVRNAARHAGASEIILRVTEVPGGLQCRVEDNGRGLSAQAVARFYSVEKAAGGFRAEPRPEYHHHQPDARAVPMGSGISLCAWPH